MYKFFSENNKLFIVTVSLSLFLQNMNNKTIRLHRFLWYQSPRTFTQTLIIADITKPRPFVKVFSIQNNKLIIG